ncbi:Initiation-specific alpha-1,6-mannosyltransferase [Galdieria sulphuraria]|nr:Initiation-specific alpha-1,6-mannosyltransferase [Galdieria sulphuraria]
MLRSGHFHGVKYSLSIYLFVLVLCTCVTFSIVFCRRCNNALTVDQPVCSSWTNSEVLQKALYASQVVLEQKQKGFTRYVPSIIHQMWYSDKETRVPLHLKRSLESFSNMNPDATHLFWRKADLLEFVMRFYPSLSSLFLKLPKTILKVDLLRYLLLLHFGGVYSDIDTLCQKPVSDWTLGDENVSVIIGYEGGLWEFPGWEQETSEKPFARDVQLTTWTVASMPYHPLIANMVHICIQKLVQMKTDDLKTYDVMDFAGPGAWTDAVLEYISPFGYSGDDIYATKVPLKVQDIYILPAAGFDWNHNGDPKLACIRHLFVGSWKRRQ